ncbi:ABC transporter ATP-binding protein [Listeria costaricensis]|uniref:ABC transporter ATP-binding protein n=1 Tax=Listeria costaricensis TaxID=2026604 RepID=UPI000C068E42|nr:ABC transporter ATP-binding protein [Listeria costaricensis]
MDAIKIQNVTKSYKDHEVLKGIDLTVQRGEIFTLLGENGAGKTTLINILSTLIMPNGGFVEIMGKTLQEPDAIRSLISLNSQFNTLDEEFSGYNNLLMIARLRGVSQPKEEITRLAERLDLTTFWKKKVSTYSGGMRRRLNMAMSLIGDPAIIFLDEPTTGIDPKNRLEIWKIIQEIRDAKKTVFLTTQYLEEADHLSDHIGFIHDGRIVLYGTPAEIKNTVSKTYSLQVADDALPKTLVLMNEAGIVYTTNDQLIELDEDNAHKGLALMTAHQIEVQKFLLNENNLETIFLNVTRKEALK